MREADENVPANDDGADLGGDVRPRGARRGGATVTPFFNSRPNGPWPARGVTYRNPYRAPIKRMRAEGNRRGARIIRGLVRDALRDLHVKLKAGLTKLQEDDKISK